MYARGPADSYRGGPDLRLGREAKVDSPKPGPVPGNPRAEGPKPYSSLASGRVSWPSMDTRRSRRIVKRAAVVMALASAGAFAVLATGESRVIQRSRAIKVGATYADVEKALGPCRMLMFFNIDSLAMCYGRPVRLELRDWIRGWRGLPPYSVDRNEWPVRIWIDGRMRVYRIERGEEAEGEPVRPLTG